MNSSCTKNGGRLFSLTPGARKTERLLVQKKKKILRLLQGPKARLMHQRKIEASSPGELSEESYLFTQDGLGGHINNSRRLFTKGLSVSECRKIVCGLVDLDRGGAVYSPEKVSSPPHTQSSLQPKQAAFSLSKGV